MALPAGHGPRFFTDVASPALEVVSADQIQFGIGCAGKMAFGAGHSHGHVPFDLFPIFVEMMTGGAVMEPRGFVVIIMEKTDRRPKSLVKTGIGNKSFVFLAYGRRCDEKEQAADKTYDQQICVTFGFCHG